MSSYMSDLNQFISKSKTKSYLKIQAGEPQNFRVIFASFFAFSNDYMRTARMPLIARKNGFPSITRRVKYLFHYVTIHYVMNLYHKPAEMYAKIYLNIDEAL
jgi:hypothetical protein